MFMDSLERGESRRKPTNTAGYKRPYLRNRFAYAPEEGAETGWDRVCCKIVRQGENPYDKK